MYSIIRKSLLAAMILSSISAFADEPLETLSCSGKAVSYTLTISSEFAPGAKVLTNVSLTQFSVNSNGTARIESDEVAVDSDRIFANKKDARKFFLKNDVSLSSEDGTELILSLKSSRLRVRAPGEISYRLLKCKDIK